MRIIYLLILVIFFATPFSVQAQETPIDPNQLAACLAAKNFTMYGRSGCSACALEKSYFGDSFSRVPYFECDASDSNREVCDYKGISAYPTWEDASGKQYKGAIPLDKLAELAGCQTAPTETYVLPKISAAPLFKMPNTQILVQGLNTLGAISLKYWAAFLAGLISFLAPCLIPLFPSYFSIITGYTFSDMYGLDSFMVKKRVFKSALFFVLGFVILFTLLGATGTIFGQFLEKYFQILLRVSGGLLVLLGLIQVGRIKIPALEFDYAWAVQRRLTKLGNFSATVAGIASALCWIPCIGPLLGGVLLLAADSKTVLEGISLLFVYSLGIGTPFILGGLFFHRVYDFFHNHRKLLNSMSKVAGVVMIAFGVIILLDKYRYYLDYYYLLIDKIPFLEQFRGSNIPLFRSLQ